MNIKQFLFLFAIIIAGGCNSEPISDASRDSSMTDSATIGVDTNASRVENPLPVSDSANTGLRKAPGNKR